MSALHPLPARPGVSLAQSRSNSISHLDIRRMKAAVELWRTTDVIGCQSRQEATDIKHNRYAAVQATPCTPPNGGFRSAANAGWIDATPPTVTKT
jgi:hypothetical protein